GWVSGRFSQLVPSRSYKYGTASRRMPSTPMPSQKLTTASKLRLTSALSKFKSGWKAPTDRKSTRLNSSHVSISYAVFCLKKKKKYNKSESRHENNRINFNSYERPNSDCGR